MANRLKVIYKIKNITNNKIYIGSAIDFNSRVRVHKFQLRNNKHHSKYLQRAWNKYGENSIEFEIIEIVNDENKLILKEQFWIDLLKPEYNICKIAGSLLGTKRAKEQKLKMSKPRSKQAKENIKKGIVSRIKVEQYSKENIYIKTYSSILEAKEKTGAQHINHVLKNKRKTSGGFIWKYTDVKGGSYRK
jgi:group I intron endonuclease